MIDDPGFGEWSIYSCPRGSRAYNLATETSDFDVLSICVPPLSHYAGLERYGAEGTKEIKEGEFDIVVYECRKFFSLALKGNPSVLEVLWVPMYAVRTTDAGDLLRKNRDVFVGRHVYGAFKDMATGHLRRMKNRPFQRCDRCCAEAPCPPCGGYDTWPPFPWKDMMHAIRVLRMGVEFLTDGELQVFRHADAEELRDIRAGKWDEERAFAEAERLLDALKEAYICSPLPGEPDYKRASDLCQEVIECALAAR